MLMLMLTPVLVLVMVLVLLITLSTRTRRPHSQSLCCVVSQHTMWQSRAEHVSRICELDVLDPGGGGGRVSGA